MNKNRDVYILFFILIVFFLINIVYLSTGRLDFWGNGLGIITGVALTLAIYSFLYKDNPVFKIAENLFVGVAMGYWIIITWFNILKPDVFETLIVPLFKDTGKAPQYAVIIPTLLGIFMLLRFSTKLSWLSRWSFAFVVGLGAGITIPNFIHAFILKQLEPTFASLYTGSIFGGINTLLILLGVVSVLIYFFFSLEHKGIIGGVSVIGVWFLMIAFGASFGYTVMARMSLLIGRIQFLIRDWLGVIQ
ncbi:MAG: hypothetical protein SCARUB_02024 [Candidatus Scalindua rubra]|uniref:Uncharacterized protein n=1 Tax=Candidatus Scalindua rubra TaxID=1872076 RepID=A0A1E3XB57_9BACT|nr:MAG: hypothetical protein SCARUB_02024 [Candidatus Scalindua rubra]